jgi:hypothetical protein
VHVPQPGNQVFSSSVYDVRRLVEFDLAGRAKGLNPPFGNHDSLIGLRSAARPINDGDVLQNKRNRCSGTNCKGTEKKQEENFCKRLHATRPIRATQLLWPHTITIWKGANGSAKPAAFRKFLLDGAIGFA